LRVTASWLAVRCQSQSSVIGVREHGLGSDMGKW